MSETCFVHGKMAMTAGEGPSSLSNAFLVLRQILKIQNIIFRRLYVYSSLNKGKNECGKGPATFFWFRSLKDLYPKQILSKSCRIN